MKKVTVLNAFTIIAYCFCFAIAIIWISVIAAFALGYYTPKTVYAEDIYIDDINENAKIEMINGYPVLRVNGISESDNPNILVDSSFVVRGKTTPIYDDDGNIVDENEVTETKIKLTSSNPAVATVQAEGEIGQPIKITVTKDAQGINKGGFCFINVTNEQNQYMSKPLVVFVDIPVTDIAVSSDDMMTEEVDGVTKFILYQNESAKISSQLLPTNSQDPSHIDNNSSFNAFRKTAKVIEYSIDENSPKNVINIDEYGNITAVGVGEVTVIAKTLRTYDDIDFVNNYDSGIPEQGDYIPPELLEGRYTIETFVVEVREVTLDEINIDGKTIQLPLFEKVEYGPSDLGISLKASNGNDDYFNNLLNDLVLTSNNQGLQITKNNQTNKWEFLLMQEISTGITVSVSVPQYPETSAMLEEFEIITKGIDELVFEGTSKNNDNSSYNDLVEISITKNGDIVSSQGNTWNWSDFVEIIPTSGNNETSYNVVKVFATGTYFNNSEYKDARYVNEQGVEIVQLGTTLFAGFGREVRGEDLTNPHLVQALARGNIALRAYVIKTDINGNPIDANGNIIILDNEGNVIDSEGNVVTENIPTFEKVAVSNEIIFRVVEELTDLSAYINIESTGTDELIGTTSTSTTSKYLAVSSVSVHQVRLLGNSNGALFDAFNNVSSSGYWIRAVSDDDMILNTSLQQEDMGNSQQNYYLNINVQNLKPTSEYIEKDIKIEYYTGDYSISSDGYETIFTLRLYIIEVPVESIQMNVNAQVSDTADDIDCYWLTGLLNYKSEMLNGRQEVNSLTSKWGMIDGSGVMTEITISQPTLTAGAIQILQGLQEGEDYLMPKALTISNTAYNYKIHDKNGNTSNVASLVSTTVGNENLNKIIIKELNTEVYITVSAAYQKYVDGVAVPITDTICVRGNLAENTQNSLQWQTQDGEYSTTASVLTLNLTEQGGGYALRDNSLFSLKFVGASTVGEDIFVSSTSQFIQFEVAGDTISKVRLIEGDKLVFAGQPLDNIEAHINVVLTTEEGCKIRQQYTIYFS